MVDINVPKVVHDTVDSATREESLSLDAGDLAELANEKGKMKDHLNATLANRAQFDALKRTITQSLENPENKMVAEDPGSRENLQALERDIDNAKAALPEEIKEIPADEEATGFEKMANGVLDPIKKLMAKLGTKGTSALVMALDMLSGGKASFMLTAANYLRRTFVEPGQIRDAIAAKKINVKKTERDSEYIKTLRAQYEAKLLSDPKQNRDIFTFEQFYLAKINELAKVAKGKPNLTYSIADLVNIPSAEQAKVEADATVKNEKEQKEKNAAKKVEDKKDQVKESLEKDPERAYVELFRDALNSKGKQVIDVKDTDKPAGIVQKIIDAFSEKNDVGFHNFGLEINDEGDLEEADGSYVGGIDYNVIDLWQQTLTSNPVTAIKDFLKEDPQVWIKTNKRAAETFQAVRNYFASHNVDQSTPTSGKPAENPVADAKLKQNNATPAPDIMPYT